MTDDPDFEATNGNPGAKGMLFVDANQSLF